MVATFFSNCHIDEGCALILLEAEQDEIDDEANIATDGEEQDYNDDGGGNDSMLDDSNDNRGSQLEF
jgi:hypothetical protein